MSTLSTTYTFSAGNLIKSAEVNQNYTDIVSWGNGNIQQDNLGTMSGTITWAITSNTLAQSISNSGTQGSIAMTYTGVLAASKAPLRISNSTAQTAGDAAVFYGESTNASTTIAAVKLSQSGTGPILDLTSTTSGALLPRMTTTQRTALTAVEGLEIWNTTLKRKEVYNGSFWVAAAGNSGTVVQWPGGTLPAYMVLCDGSTLAVNATNAYAISVLGSTWGASGQLPDNRGRTPICSGTGSGLTARTLGQQSIGEETHILSIAELPAHDHGGGSHSHSGSTDSGGSHQHNTGVNRRAANGADSAPFGAGSFTPGELQSMSASGSGGQLTDSGGTHSHSLSISSSGAIISSQGSGTAHNTMPPAIVYHICMVL